MDFYLIDVLSIIFEALIINTFFNAVGSKGNNKWLKLVNYLSFILVLSVIYLLTDLVWIKLILLFVYMFVLSLSHNISIKLRWLSVLILFIIINVVEMLVGFIMSAVFFMTVSTIRETILYYTVGVLASKTLTFLIAKLIQFKNKTNDIKVSKSIIALYSIFPIITLAVGIILIGGFGADISPMYSVVGVIAEILLVIANISVFYIFERYARKTNTQFELQLEQEQLKLQSQYLEEKIEKQILSAKEMHDLKNQLFAIKQLLINNTSDGISKIDEICQVVEGMQCIVYTSNKSIDSLINSKKKEIDLNNISFKCDCYISGFDEINDLDLCVLLGNLLDNAIEACLKLESRRSIKLSFKQFDNYLNIIIRNTYINDNNEKLYTTKVNKLIHGFGLKSVKSIVEKYEGNYQIIKADGFFTTSILLKNTKDKPVMT